jgi:hypothetical protein
MKKLTGTVSAAVALTAVAVFLAAYAGFALYSPAKLQLSPPTCALQIIRGEVLVMEKDALNWEKASDGMALEPGTQIKTAADADASLTFLKGTTTRLESGTGVIIDKIENAPDAPGYTVVLKQLSGRTWNQVDSAAGHASFQIRTNSTNIQVHGTLFPPR